MSKIDELWSKYKDNVSNNIFIKFDQSDRTPTKKYLPYLVKTWAEKNKTGNKITSLSLIDLVRQFDLYINYIEVKDIYNPIYSDVNTLRSVVDAAVIKFEEKTSEEYLEKAYSILRKRIVLGGYRLAEMIKNIKLSFDNKRDEIRRQFLAIIE